MKSYQEIIEGELGGVDVEEGALGWHGGDESGGEIGDGRTQRAGLPKEHLTQLATRRPRERQPGCAFPQPRFPDPLAAHRSLQETFPNFLSTALVPALVSQLSPPFKAVGAPA